MNVTIIGAGNVATVLGILIKNAGHTIHQVYSRSTANAAGLAKTLTASLVTEWADINQESDIYLVALSDTALTNLYQNWHCNAGLLLHTAGAVSVKSLASVANNYGVLYPLQSIRKERLDYETIPLLVDANTTENLQTVSRFAQSLSTLVQTANDEQRQHLHLAAVIANNFSNYLYTLSADYCAANGVNFTLLQPLLSETADRLKNFAPATVQTGPAARKDMATIQKHIALLNNFPALQQVYTQLTESILQYQSPSENPH